MAAGYYSLGPIACHSLITLKWATDTARQSEAGWDVVAAERPGIYILGWTWLGWHGHGITKLLEYYLIRATLGPEWGLDWDRAYEFDPSLITQFQVQVGYYAYLHLMPKLCVLFDCKNRIKSSVYNESKDKQLAYLSGRTALACHAVVVRASVVNQRPVGRA